MPMHWPGDLHAAAVQHLHGELESRAFGPDARILRNLAIEGETEHVTAFQSHGFFRARCAGNRRRRGLQS